MVERLMVVDHPLAEDGSGNGSKLLQRSVDLAHSYGVTPQSAVVGTAVGLFLAPGLVGAAKGFLLGSLLSFGINRLKAR
jgi:hypothetical protein